MVEKYKLIQRIENVAPPETAEPWDLSGWLIEYSNRTVKKAMLCLTVTEDILHQAQENNCDIIIAHHPLFTVPLNFNRGIDIYCAHTNLDKASIGTTETLIQTLDLTPNHEIQHDFLRFCDKTMTLQNLIEKLKTISSNIRYTNPQELSTVKRIAFCAGSGAEFWHDAFLTNADVLVTGDLKFHAALDSKIAIIDIGHFESEILVLKALAKLLQDETEICIAKEKSPIKQINS